MVSEELAKNGLKDSLDYLIREPESTKRFYLIVAIKSDAKDVLQIVSPLESFPSQSISIAISFSKESQAVTSNIPYSSFIEKLVQKGIEPVLPSIEIKGNIEEGKSKKALEETSPKTYLKLSNLVLFKKDKLVHIADEEESYGINIINDNVDETLVKINCNNSEEYINIQLSNVKSNKKYKNNKIILNIKSNADIQENNCDIDLEDNKNISYIKEETEKKVKKIVEDSIELAKKYKTDIFGFGNVIYKHNPNYFDSIYKDWNDEEFIKLNIDTNIEIKLEDKGSLKSNIKEA